MQELLTYTVLAKLCLQNKDSILLFNQSRHFSLCGLAMDASSSIIGVILGPSTGLKFVETCVQVNPSLVCSTLFHWPFGELPPLNNWQDRI